MSEILTGWKAISVYLEVSEITVRRYYKLRGLPVKKDPSGHPVTRKQDLDSWKMNETRPPDHF